MGFNLVEYNILKDSLIESIRTEIKSFDSKKDLSPEKLFESAQCLSEIRRVQAQFILKSITILDGYADAENEQRIEKSRILNTLAFCIHEDIVDTYGLLSPERSTFKKALSTSLDLKVGNKPGYTDLYDMFPCLIKFLQDNVYVKGDVRRGYLPDQKFVIDGFSVEDYIGKVKVADLSNDRTLTALAKQKNQKLQPSTGYFGWFSGSSSSTPVKPTTESVPGSVDSGPK